MRFFLKPSRQSTLTCSALCREALVRITGAILQGLEGAEGNLLKLFQIFSELRTGFMVLEAHCQRCFQIA